MKINEIKLEKTNLIINKDKCVVNGSNGLFEINFSEIQLCPYDWNPNPIREKLIIFTPYLTNTEYEDSNLKRFNLSIQSYPKPKTSDRNEIPFKLNKKIPKDFDLLIKINQDKDEMARNHIYLLTNIYKFTCTIYHKLDMFELVCINTHEEAKKQLDNFIKQYKKYRYKSVKGFKWKK